MLVNIVVWAVFGLLAGVVAKYIWRQPGHSHPMGILITIVLGIAGALVGGWVSSNVFNWDITTFSIPGFAVAVGGALLLLFLYRLLMSPGKAT
jgi:uncharacterized membrane protein YeaQ/YmgE (transglycosylase-associated protein family)